MVNPVKKAILFVILLMLTPWASADSSTWEGPEITPEDAGLEPSYSTYDGFPVPTNATITDSVFEVAPVWVEAEDNAHIGLMIHLGDSTLAHQQGLPLWVLTVI